MNSSPHPTEPPALSRRDAIKRAAVILGAAISPSLLAGLMSAEPPAAAAAGRPLYLNAKQFEIAAAAAGRIIPRTDTPGAGDVGVPGFIDLMYGKYLSEPEKELFRHGLAELEAASVQADQRAFSEQSPVRQDSLLRRMAAGSPQPEKTFLQQIRELTLVGYFTSEVVGKNVLHFDPVPGRYDGCVPISEVGNVAWTVK